MGRSSADVGPATVAGRGGRVHGCAVPGERALDVSSLGEPRAHLRDLREHGLAARAADDVARVMAEYHPA